MEKELVTRGRGSEWVEGGGGGGGNRMLVVGKNFITLSVVG